MVEELTADKVVYNVDIENIRINNKVIMPQYKMMYDKIKTAMEINGNGYNVYLIEEFSEEKLKDIVDYVQGILKNKSKPKDICYVANEDEKNPKCIVVDGGKAGELKKSIEEIKIMYKDVIYDFYNDNSHEEKLDIINNIQKKKNELVEVLVERSREEGFEIKSTQGGFNFIPIKNEKLLTEDEYDTLSTTDKNAILQKVNMLKIEAKILIDKLKALENNETDKLKELFRNYLITELEHKKTIYVEDFKKFISAKQYILDMFSHIEDSVIENYTISYEDDEENINTIIEQYYANIIVDNVENDYPQVIYEDDPSVNNLMGSIEYENRSGNYYTDTSLIKAGSLLKANEGCLIIKMSNLAMYPSAYYYLKKALTNGKVSFDFNRGYFELISLNGLNPEPINIKGKIIIIGDYGTYDVLYNLDEDFKKIFKIRAELNDVIEIDDEIKAGLLQYLDKYIANNKINPLSQESIKKIIKSLSRKIENRNKLLFDTDELDKILMLSDNNSRKKNKCKIEEEDIEETIFSEDLIEKEIIKMFETEKILLDVKSKVVGQINGLSVIDNGYISFGKPIRITCTTFKGDGNIIDVHKESHLSGKLHCKSIGILKGCINRIFEDYNRISVDFHLCFEQLYGNLEGDSATVAEAVCIISSLAKIPIKQNIAITGSVDQFGNIQPIGGVNEKIEGFFKICKVLDSVNNKGVLIPASNADNIVLNSEVEKAVQEGKFHIYIMKDLNDAIDLLMGEGKLNSKKIIETAKAEMKKYNGRR